MKTSTTLAAIIATLSITSASATIIDLRTAVESMDKSSLNQFVTFFKQVKIDKDSTTIWKSKTDTYEVAAFGQLDINGMQCKNYFLAMKSGAYTEGTVCYNGKTWLFDVE
jgi:hypothetical protein